LQGLQIHSALFLSVTVGLSMHNLITGAISNVIGTSVGTQGFGSQGGSSGGAGASADGVCAGPELIGVCGITGVFSTGKFTIGLLIV
jgi:hypothetical protein